MRRPLPRQRHDRLAVEPQAILLHDLGQARDPLHLTVTTGQLEIPGFVYLHAVAALFLGGGAGGVGLGQNLAGACVFLGDRHDTNARTEMEHPALPFEAHRAHPLEQLFGHGHRLCERTARQQQRELVTSEARAGVVVAHALLQVARELAQQLVAGHMPAGVVDHLELVEVKIAQGMLPATRTQLFEHALEAGRSSSARFTRPVSRSWV